MAPVLIYTEKNGSPNLRVLSSGAAQAIVNDDIGMQNGPVLLVKGLPLPQV